MSKRKKNHRFRACGFFKMLKVFGILPVSSYNIFETFLQNSWDFQNPCEDRLPEQRENCAAGDQPPEGYGNS